MKLRPIALAALCCALCATEPNDATRRWWAHVVAMGNDAMQGRDTGSEAYRKAAAYVVAQFGKNGLEPAGEHGYYQTVPLRVVRLRTDESSIELVRPSGVTKLQWLRQVTTAARAGLPERLEAPLVFAGSDRFRRRPGRQDRRADAAAFRARHAARGRRGRHLHRQRRRSRTGSLAGGVCRQHDDSRRPGSAAGRRTCNVSLQSRGCGSAVRHLGPHLARTPRPGSRRQAAAALPLERYAARQHEGRERRSGIGQHRCRAAGVRPGAARPVRGGVCPPGWLRTGRALERRPHLQRRVRRRGVRGHAHRHGRAAARIEAAA